MSTDKQVDALEWMHNEVEWPEWCVRSYWEGTTIHVLNIISKNGYSILPDGAIYFMPKGEYAQHEQAYFERYPESL